MRATGGRRQEHQPNNDRGRRQEYVPVNRSPPSEHFNEEELQNAAINVILQVYGDNVESSQDLQQVRRS